MVHPTAFFQKKHCNAESLPQAMLTHYPHSVKIRTKAIYRCFQYKLHALHNALNSERPQLADAVEAVACHVPAAPVQCDVDCAAGQSAVGEDRLPASAWPPADPSLVKALLVLLTDTHS